MSKFLAISAQLEAVKFSLAYAILFFKFLTLEHVLKH